MNIMEKMGLMLFIIGLFSVALGSGDKTISALICVGGCFVFLIFGKDVI